MSKYTTELRTICENLAGLGESVGYNSIAEVISNSRDKIFNFDYPIFDENYKEVLETKILKYYYTNEICCETVGLWKLFLDETMNRIMPYYNQLYESALIKYNPLTTTEMNTIHNNINKSTGDSTHNSSTVENDIIDKDSQINNINSESNIDNKNGSVDGQTNSNTVKSGLQNSSVDSVDKYSETPQGTITNLSNNTYLTNATIKNDSGTQNNNEINSAQGNDHTTSNETSTHNKINNNETRENELDSHNKINQSLTAEQQNNTSLDNYIEQVAGRGVAGADLILKLRETFLNIDQLIIDNLHDLFMLVW